MRMLRPCVLASCVALFGATEAQAVLGAHADTVQADQVRFQGVRASRVLPQMTAHEISLPDGSTVKEYVNASGLVFAVAWRTRLKPDLANLLGSTVSVAAAGDPRGAGVAGSKAPRSVRQANLVVHQGGRMNAFAGLAYVPNLVPEGFDADSLR